LQLDCGENSPQLGVKLIISIDQLLADRQDGMGGVMQLENNIPGHATHSSRIPQLSTPICLPVFEDCVWGRCRDCGPRRGRQLEVKLGFPCSWTKTIIFRAGDT